jgi:hypothetical protein
MGLIHLGMPIEDYVPLNEMIFINKVVHDLLKEEGQKLILVDSQVIQNVIQYGNIDYHSVNDSTESTDSYPTSRGLIQFMGKDSNKSCQIEEWLNTSTSSFDVMLEDTKPIDMYIGEDEQIYSAMND